MGIAIRNEQSLDLAFKIVFGLSFFLLSCIDNSNNNYYNNNKKCNKRNSVYFPQ